MIYTHTEGESGLSCHGYRARGGPRARCSQARPQPTHHLPVGPGLQSIYHIMLDLLFEKIEMMECISIGRKLYFFLW